MVIKYVWQESLWKAVKEPLREIVLAAIPGVLLYLEKLNMPWATILYLVLRTLDQYIHEQGKATKDKTLKLGLVRF